MFRVQEVHPRRKPADDLGEGGKDVGLGSGRRVQGAANEVSDRDVPGTGQRLVQQAELNSPVGGDHNPQPGVHEMRLLNASLICGGSQAD